MTRVEQEDRTVLPVTHIASVTDCVSVNHFVRVCVRVRVCGKTAD